MITGKKFAAEALVFVGYPSMFYRHPKLGQNIKWFDCSGFVWFLLKKLKFPFDKRLRHTNEFFDRLGVFIHEECADKGDLVFWSWDGLVPRHVGVMLSATEYVHAPGRDKTFVSVAKLKTQKTPINSSLKNQIYFHNPIGYKRLAVRVGRYQKIIE